jgi:hypothetical protein
MLLRVFSAIVRVLLDHLFAAVPNPRLDRVCRDPGFHQRGYMAMPKTMHALVLDSEFRSVLQEIVPFLERKWAKGLEYRSKRFGLARMIGSPFDLRMNGTMTLETGSVPMGTRTGNLMQTVSCAYVWQA